MRPNVCAQARVACSALFGAADVLGKCSRDNFIVGNMSIEAHHHFLDLIWHHGVFRALASERTNRVDRLPESNDAKLDPKRHVSAQD